MISVKLKVKHMLIVADNLFEVIANESFATLQKIRDAVSGKGDDEDTSILIEWERVYNAWLVMTTKTSGEYKTINDEMEAMLMPQVQAGVIAKDPEWIAFAQSLGALKAQQAAVVPAKIEQAKKRLLG